MHFKIPIVAFESTAVGETLGTGGVLLDKKDPQTVAEAIDKLINDEELIKVIRESQEKRLKDFTYEKITHKLWDFLVNFEPKIKE